MSTANTSVCSISRSQSCTPMTAETRRSLMETVSVTPPMLGQPEHGLVPRAELTDVAGYPRLYRVARPVGMNGERQLAAADGDQQRGLLELQRERKAIQPAGEPGGEVQDTVAELGACVIPLHDVERPGHDAHVDPFLCRAALDVLDIAPERDEKPLPRALRVESGEHPRVGDKAQ